jgi:large repetitive protein
LSKGAGAQGQPGCTSTHCHFLHIVMSNFPSGNYTVDCMENGTKFNTGTITVSSTADEDLPCYNGDDADVFLRVLTSTGNVDSNHVNPATQW